MVYDEGAYIHWLKFLCRGKQSLRLKDWFQICLEKWVIPGLRHGKSRMSLGHLHVRREGGRERTCAADMRASSIYCHKFWEIITAGKRGQLLTLP